MSFDDDYEYGDNSCPKCGHYPTHWRRCSELDCNDGFIESNEVDDFGEFYTCPTCKGTGIEAWCPNCGADLSLPQDEETL